MKKEYSTPIVEKIAFNYRDQVVAASGFENGGGTTGDDNEFIDTTPRTNGWGTATCSALKDLSEGITLWSGCLFG